MEVETNPASDDEDFAPRRVHNYKNIIDSDSEEEAPPQNDVAKKDDSDEDNEQPDSSSEDEQPAPAVDRRKNANPKKNFLPVKSQRKSAAKAKEIIKEKMTNKEQEELKIKIQSEKQRMEREQEIRVPYHKPKQMSLKEFLSRRTINKPSLDKIRKGEMPMSSVLDMKMSSRGEGLVKLAKEMKEREEEAIEFFKSESESDDEDIDETENKENVSENAKPESNLQEIVNETEVLVTAHAVEEVAEDDKQDNQEVVQLESEQMDVLTVEPEKVIEETQIEPPKVEDSVLESLREKYANLPEIKKEDTVYERLKEKYKHLSEKGVPTLKTLQEMGAKDSQIDLSTGVIEPRKLTGPEMLFQRYLKTVQKPKPKDTICMNILSVENGRLENQKVEVKLTKETEVDHDRPGLARGKLQGNLLSQIKQKRHEEIMKRIEAQEPHELEPEDKDASDEEFDEAVDEGEFSEGESEPEPEPELVESKKKKSAGCGFLDEEAIDEDEPDEDDDDSESESSSASDSDEEAEANDLTAAKKSRILKAFVDSDDEEKPAELPEAVIEEPSVTEEVEATENPDVPTKSFGDDPFALTQVTTPRSSEQFTSQATEFTFTEPSVSEEMNKGDAGNLWDSGPSQMEDEDFMDILSGRFTTTQGPTITEDLVEKASEDIGSDSQFVSQVPDNPEVDGVKEIVTESENFDSEVPDSTKPVTPPKNTRKLLDSSDEEVDENAAKKKRKKLRKKRKHKVVKLGFSDDEDESFTNQAPELEESGSENLEECEEEEEEVDVLVDYDSEENEVEVKMNKKDRIKAAGAYLEKEAELSESEWGSADENEENLDKFEGELGDEDQFDQDQLQEEVGRIHARKVLDDDIRNVKKIEELLFEDEENDGVGRERKFRWKNQKEGFAPADENAMDGDLLEDDDAEFESETAWRKMRHERETLLSEHASKFTESDTMADEITLLDHESQTVTSLSTSAFITKKFKIIKSSSAMECPSTSEVKKESPFLIKQMNFKKFTSSSFLSRDEQTLSKLARMVSHKDEEVQNFSHGSNSMSFMTIDKPEESKKRKSAVVTPKEAPNSGKKRKVEVKSRKLLLDQLN